MVFLTQYTHTYKEREVVESEKGNFLKPGKNLPTGIYPSKAGRAKLNEVCYYPIHTHTDFRTYWGNDIPVRGSVA